MTFSNKLQKLRKDSNLSQEQLASELRVSRQAISKWELGTLPDINNLMKISNFFDCSLDFLMDDENKDKSENGISKTDKERQNVNLIVAKNRLNILLPGFGMTVSIIFLIILKLLSVISPAPINRQAENETWYTDFIGYIDYHNLYGVINVGLFLFMISFTILIFFLFWKKSNSRKRLLFALVGYVMIIILCIKSLYELNTKSFVAMNFSEIVVSIIYIACAVLFLLLGNENFKVNVRR